VPTDVRRAHGALGYRTKQLIMLASDVRLEAVRGNGRGPAAVAAQLVDDGTLPGCYRSRYDEGFLDTFHNVVELTRNALVSDLANVPTTAGVLAALAILREARATVAAGGDGRQALAAAIDPRLPAFLARDGEGFRRELSELEGVRLEDTDVLALFTVPSDRDPDEHLRLALRDHDRALLRFENWLVPFGNPPRPRIAADGRVWPSDV
jgi:hypothetical protein